jgi:hypothetical protein
MDFVLSANVLEECRDSLQNQRFADTISRARAAWNVFLHLPLDEQEDKILFAADILGLLSEALWRSGARQESIDTVVSIYSLNPADHELAIRVGLFMRKAKLPAVAITYYERALELVPGSVRIKMALKALRTDIRLLQNSPGSRHPAEFSFPSLSPLSPSFVPNSPPASDGAFDTLQLINSFSNTDIFTVPPSRDEPQRQRPSPADAFHVKAPAVDTSSNPHAPVAALLSSTAKGSKSVDTFKPEVPVSMFVLDSTVQTDTFPDQFYRDRPHQRNAFTTRKIFLLALALTSCCVLHNALEGSSRPVFRIVGIPLSTFSAVLIFSSLFL